MGWLTNVKIIMEKSLRLGFLATNNEVEYEALLARMIMVKKTWKQSCGGFL